MDERKYVNITFKENQYLESCSELIQWDYGQYLRIYGLNILDPCEVHFSMQEYGGTAAVMNALTEEDAIVVKVPRFILEADKTHNYNAFAFVYVSNEESGRTENKIRLTVNARPRPEDYVHGEDEIKTWVELEKRIEDIEKNGAGGESGEETAGKSAYEYAKDGGYTGTEEEFAEKLALEWASAEDVNKHKTNSNIHVTSEEKKAWNDKSNFSGSYNDLSDKPSIPSLSGYATETYVKEYAQPKGDYLTSVPSEYVTETELNAKGYLTQHQSLSGYAKTSEIPTKVSQLANDSGYLTSIPSEYVTESELTEKGYAKQSEVDELSETIVNQQLTDEHESPVLGSELATASGWTSTGWTGDFASGFTHTSGNTNALSFTIPNIAVGKSYVIEFDSSVDYTNTNLLVTIGSAPSMLLYGIGKTNTKVGVIAVDTGALTFTPESGFVGKISNISIKEITAVSTPRKTITDSDGNVINEVRHVGESLFIGKGVGGKNVDGNGNYAIGNSETFQNNISGFWNVAFGHDCMQSNVSGSRNVSIGANNLRENVEGCRNVAIGNFCLTQAKSVHRTVAIGADCMSTATGGSDCVAIGFQSLYTNTTGYQNVAVGYNTLHSNTTGLANTAIGYNALSSVTTGRTNVAIGANAGKSLKTGYGNIVIGYNADIGADTYYGLNIGNLLKGSVASGSAYLLINGGLRLPNVGTEASTNNTVYAEEWTFTLEDDSTVTKKVLLV